MPSKQVWIDFSLHKWHHPLETASCIYSGYFCLIYKNRINHEEARTFSERCICRGSERHGGLTSPLVFTYDFINFPKVEQSAFCRPARVKLPGSKDNQTQPSAAVTSFSDKHESGYTGPLNLPLLIYRTALCDDVTTGGFDGVQSKDDCTSNSAVHCVIPSHVSRIRALDI